VQTVVAAVTAASHKAVNQPGGSTNLEGHVPVPTPQVVIQADTGPVTSVMQPGNTKGWNAMVQDGAAVANKKKTGSCFHCKQPGHYIDDCTVPMCDICESITHASNACHLLHAPKPTVAMYGYANEALMFFEVPFRGTYKPKVENAKLAKVTILFQI
jgi:hypothetical protein